MLSEDHRWVDLCVGLRDHDYLGRSARQALEYADPAVTGPALDAAAAARAAHPRPRVPRLAAGSLAKRYQRGDCRGAWQDLRVADPPDDTWRAEAEQLATLTMQRVRRSAEHLVTALIARGWPVTAEKALPEPAPDIEQRLQQPKLETTANSAHAKLRALGERANAQLKTWHILRKLRCCPWKAGQIAKAIHVLQMRDIRG